MLFKKTYRPQWTDIISQEWKSNLLKNRPDLIEKSLNRTLNLMNLTFPNANIVAFEHHIDSLTLPDENDRHVVAAAIECHAKFIVTFNLKDFPKSVLEPLEIIAIHPSIFVYELFKNDELSVRTALNTQISLLKNPPKTRQEVLEMLEKCGLKKFVTLF